MIHDISRLTLIKCLHNLSLIWLLSVQNALPYFSMIPRITCLIACHMITCSWIKLKVCRHNKKTHRFSSVKHITAIWIPVIYIFPPGYVQHFHSQHAFMIFWCHILLTFRIQYIRLKLEWQASSTIISIYITNNCIRQCTCFRQSFKRKYRLMVCSRNSSWAGCDKIVYYILRCPSYHGYCWMVDKSASGQHWNGHLLRVMCIMGRKLLAGFQSSSQIKPTYVMDCMMKCRPRTCIIILLKKIVSILPWTYFY